MARVEVQRLRKTYGSMTALDGVDLDIRSGEFFTLLGPSGCGKTTLLRTIAGFHRQDSGHLLVQGKPLDDVPAHRRNIGMVFQDYAIFPHLTVAQNVAFGLENRKVPKAEVRERVAKALEVVQLGSHANRLPHQMSGGQQQRVGLARAMVIRPQILLMDEPLSNLDAKLRLELRDDIRDLQRSMGITTIYVTHDQEEALVVSDRICVMQGGTIHQVGTPFEVYATPATLFTATFVGTMNLLPPAIAAALPGVHDGTQVTIRPEDIAMVEPAQADAGPPAITVPGKVDKVSFAGREAACRVLAADGTAFQVHVHRPERDLSARLGREVALRLPLDQLHGFELTTGGRKALPA